MSAPAKLRPRRCVPAIVAGIVLSGAAVAQESVGEITLLTGTPRMTGQSLLPAAPVLSGRPVETGPDDAVGVLMQDLVVHVGADSQVEFTESDTGPRIRIESGFVVLYHDDEYDRPVIVETPFGRIEPLAEDGGFKSGAYTIRHDPERPGLRAAATTFSVIEGDARALATDPEAGPHVLHGGQMWVIRRGEIPGDPVEGDEGRAADELAALLHRDSIETLRTETALLAPEDDLDGVAPRLLSMSLPGQDLISINDIARVLDVPAPTPPRLQDLVFETALPAELPAGNALTGEADFVSYNGIVRNEDWNQHLAAVNGNPAFRPTYVRALPNSGLSYIQIASPDAAVRTAPTGEQFLAPGDNSTGWTLYTPDNAIADRGFGSASNTATIAVVDAALRFFASAPGLPNAGTIGPSAGQPGFATLADINGQQNVILNPDQPAGFPLLRRAGETGGLEVPVSQSQTLPIADQIAAVADGRDPFLLTLGQPRLTFLSDTAGGFDFNGNPINPTNFNFPSDRSVDVLPVGNAAQQAIPLATTTNNTVGLQFAPRGEVVAIIHHDGTRSAGDNAPATSEHFVIERGPRFTVIRWNGDTRPAGANGQALEFEQLNADVAIRNELFGLVSDEVNALTPTGRQTIFGPSAVASTGSAATKVNQGPPRFVRSADTLMNWRQPVQKMRIQTDKLQLRASRAAEMGSGLRATVPGGMQRRYIGHNAIRR